MKIISFVILFMLIACSPEEPVININITAAHDATPEDRLYIEKATYRLFNACPGLKKYWIDVETSEAEIIKSSLYSEYENYGWAKFTEITIRIKNAPQKIPAEYRARGHNCFYRIGDGNIPGIGIMKRPCAAICEDKFTDNSDTFITD